MTGPPYPYLHGAPGAHPSLPADLSVAAAAYSQGLLHNNINPAGLNSYPRGLVSDNLMLNKSNYYSTMIYLVMIRFLVMTLIQALELLDLFLVENRRILSTSVLMVKFSQFHFHQMHWMDQEYLVMQDKWILLTMAKWFAPWPSVIQQNMFILGERVVLKFGTSVNQEQKILFHNWIVW